MVTGNLTEFPAETVLVFRCKDIGKFSMIGSVRRTCINGEWDGIKPACFGLSQENDYARMSFIFWYTTYYCYDINIFVDMTPNRLIKVTTVKESR